MATTPKIRFVSVVDKNDSIAIGNVLFTRSEVAMIGWFPNWGRVMVKIRCHADWVETDVTNLADWQAWLAALPS